MCVHATARNTNNARQSVFLPCMCTAMMADGEDINDDGGEDGEDSLLMVHALQKNETCNITNTSTNESHIIIRCLIDKGLDAHTHTLKYYKYALLFFKHLRLYHKIQHIHAVK